MEFWGIEIKAGESVKVAPNNFSVIHLSQAALPESKKGSESATLSVKVDDKKIVLGTLSHDKFPQLSFDVVFEKEVELSHTWKNGSIYLSGYQSVVPMEDEGMYSDEEEESEDEEPLPVKNAENGAQKVAATKSNVAKPDSSTKQKAKPVQPSKPEEDADDDDDDDEDGDEDESDDEDDSEEGMSVDEESDDEDDSDSEDEETPKEVGKGKKRQNDSAVKTPVPSKKAKPATPQKTDCKKGSQPATPHPAKGGKASANGGNSKPQAPKSGGKFSCNSCERTFGSDAALQSHSKAKHSGK